MGVGNRLKNILQMKGMTIKQLSEKTGVSINTLYSITKRDSDHVKTEIIERIAAALELPPSTLIGYDQDAHYDGMSDDEIKDMQQRVWNLYKQNSDVGFEERLHSAYHLLSRHAQEKVVVYAEDMARVPGYTKKAAPKDGE